MEKINLTIQKLNKIKYDVDFKKIKSIYNIKKSDFNKKYEIEAKYKNIPFFITYDRNTKRYYYYEAFTKLSGFQYSIKDLINDIKYTLKNQSIF